MITFFDLLFPKDIKCISCGRDLNLNTPYLLCENCFQTIEFTSGPRCILCNDVTNAMTHVCDACKLEHPLFNKALTSFDYNGKIKKILHDFKFNNLRYLYKPLSTFLFDTCQNFNVEFDYITSVPSNNKERKYNPCQLLAKELSRLTKIKYIDTLIKTSDCQLKELNKKERKSADIFNLITKEKSNNILLIDDIITTCSTANLCTKELKKNFKNVYVLALCRTRGDTKKVK